MFNVNLCVLVFLLNMNVRCFVLFDRCYFLICIVCYMNVNSVFELYNLKKIILFKGKGEKIYLLNM